MNELLSLALMIDVYHAYSTSKKKLNGAWFSINHDAQTLTKNTIKRESLHIEQKEKVVLW